MSNGWPGKHNRVREMKDLVKNLEVELNQFYDKGNKSAGTRARKQLQELKKLSQKIRIEIQELKKSEES